MTGDGPKAVEGKGVANSGGLAEWKSDSYTALCHSVRHTYRHAKTAEDHISDMSPKVLTKTHLFLSKKNSRQHAAQAPPTNLFLISFKIFDKGR